MTEMDKAKYMDRRSNRSAARSAEIKARWDAHKKAPRSHTRPRYRKGHRRPVSK